ncbi:MAG TPA: VOC family protein [Candidatus Acidoferrales bacterium]|nr:VOC family protein [Candidatus Acidoferrales bacterium]
MPKVTSLGHIGLYVRDVERSVAFYRDVLGLQVSDRSPRGSVFMTAQDRLAEHHELLIAPGRQDGTTNTLQQISFRCASLADIKDFHRLFLERKVPIQRIVTHGNTVSIYFEDPDSNTVEVYWPTRIDVPQPFGKPVDLTKSDAEILAQVKQLIAEGQQQS